MSFTPSINLRTRGDATTATPATLSPKTPQSIATIAIVAGELTRKYTKNDLSSLPEEDAVPMGAERMQADVAAIRERFRRPPMLYADMPDWWAFCSGYPHCDEIGCPYLDAGKACWCRLWEASFPHVVHWYDWPE